MDKRRQLWERILNRYELSLWGPPPLPRRSPMPSIQQIVSGICSRQSSEEKKTHVCSDTYVNCRPKSSWEHLTSLLYEADEMTAVDQARAFLPPRGKLTIIKQHLMLVVGHMRYGRNGIQGRSQDFHEEGAQLVK